MGCLFVALARATCFFSYSTIVSEAVGVGCGDGLMALLPGIRVVWFSASVLVLHAASTFGGDPAANVFRAMDDANSPGLHPREEPNGVPGHERHVLEVQDDAPPDVVDQNLQSQGVLGIHVAAHAKRRAVRPVRATDSVGHRT